jgi:hypothetical protein
MDYITWEAGCWYVMDRGDLDFERLHLLHQSQSWFVTRSKKNTMLKRLYSQPVDKNKGIICDQKVRLMGKNMKKNILIRFGVLNILIAKRGSGWSF